MGELINRQPNNRLLYSHQSDNAFGIAYIGTQWYHDQSVYADRTIQFDEEIGQYIESEYDSLISGMTTEGITVDTARVNAVEDRWGVYHFFAQDEIGAPEEVFTYVDDDGNVVPFSDADLAKIQNWESGTGTPIDDIEGHHLHPVSYYPDNVELAADPNNITFATSEAHFEHLHGGNYTNYTTDEYLNHPEIYTHEEMLQKTLHVRQEDFITANPLFAEAGILSYASANILTAVALHTVIQSAFQLYRLRHSKFTNHQIGKIMLQQNLRQMSHYSIIASSAVGAKMSFDAIFHNVEISLLGMDVLLGSFDIFFGVGVGSIVSNFIKYLLTYSKNPNEVQTKKYFLQSMKSSIKEMFSLSALSIGSTKIIEMARGGDLLSISDYSILNKAILVAKKVYGLFKEKTENRSIKEMTKIDKQLRLKDTYAQAKRGIRQLEPIQT